jgi:hypothetical protein
MNQSFRRGGVQGVMDRFAGQPLAPEPPPQSFPQPKAPTAPTKGLKIQNVNQVEKERQQAEKEQILNSFNAAADKTIEYDTELKKRPAEITQRFMAMAQSKVLKRNKTNVNVSIESQIVKEVISLGMELDNNLDPRDPNVQFGVGSISLMTMLLNILLNQRDKINDLEYDYKVLKQELTDLKKELGA